MEGIISGFAGITKSYGIFGFRNNDLNVAWLGFMVLFTVF